MTAPKSVWMRSCQGMGVEKVRKDDTARTMPVARGVRLVRSNPPSKWGVRLVWWNTTSPRRNRPENSFNYSHYPPRIHGTSSTTPLEIGAGKLLQLPPSNSRNFIDYPPPPSKSGRENYPPRNRAGKLLQLPASNSRNFIDYPPPRNRSEPPFSKPWLRPCAPLWICKIIKGVDE